LLLHESPEVRNVAKDRLRGMIYGERMRRSCHYFHSVHIFENCLAMISIDLKECAST
jgi:hypothetical protein